MKMSAMNIIQHEKRKICQIKRHDCPNKVNESQKGRLNLKKPDGRLKGKWQKGVSNIESQQSN